MVTDLDALFSGDENSTETEYEDNDDNDNDTVGYITVANILLEHSESQNQSDEQLVHSTIQNDTNNNTNIDDMDIYNKNTNENINTNESENTNEKEIKLRNAKYGNIEKL